MQKSDLFFEYPEHLVATEKKPVSRVMMVQKGDPRELSIPSVLSQIPPGDLLVVNDTKVIPARVSSQDGLEILFIKALGENTWQVLCPARKWPVGQQQSLPGGVKVTMLEKGRPQKVETDRALDSQYFFEFGEMPLPPYIQEARGERAARPEDRLAYQTDWAQELGSLAAPTASLHFKQEDLQKVRSRGADVASLCLHVGLGTFLPIHSDNIDDHEMHPERVVIRKQVWQKIKDVRSQGGRVWALGSTVTRALESQALGLLQETEDSFAGDTRLFIKPGFEFQVVDVLMTNFHQPESTLIAMVMAFAGVESVKANYQWAIDRNFRLFSYGDLSVWLK